MKTCFLGFGLGTALSVVYLLFGSWFLYTPQPEWAQIVFSPGVVVGHTVYAAGLKSIPLCQAAGVVTMGLVGAVIGVLAGLPLKK